MVFRIFIDEIQMNDTSRLINSNALLIAGFSHVSNELEELKEMVRKRVAVVPCEKAIKSFNLHINTRLKQPRNYKYLLEQFQSRFAERNIAELTAMEVEDFLASRWSGSSFNTQKNQLSSFFSFCIKEQQRSNAPVFVNPTTLIEKNKEKKADDFRFVDTETILRMLDLAGSEQIWLWIAILVSSGMRIKELWKLRPCDINSRVMTLVEPKSGREIEYSVIPQVVEDKLLSFIRHKRVPSESRIWSSAYGTFANKVYERIVLLSTGLGFRYTPHSLRKWCATFYDREGETGMRRAILRHSSVQNNMTALECRYVAVYSIEEMKTAQDGLLTRVLFS